MNNEGRHLILSPGADNVMHLAAIVQVSDMVPEGEELFFTAEETGGVPEVLMGPKTYAEQIGEDDDGG